MKIPSPHLYSAYKSLMGKDQPVALPPLSTTVSTLILVAYTVIYVAPFYFSSATRPSATLNRNAELVIKARIRSVTISTVLCLLTTFFILVHFSKATTRHDVFWSSIHSLGFYPIGITETLKSMTLLVILFSGPLFEAGIVEDAWKDWIRLRGLSDLLSDWHLYRNLVAGPVTEELLFRSAALPLYLISPASASTLIFLTPLVFGLAHIHHIYESSYHTPLPQAVLQSFVQLCYTTLFGSFVAFVYLRTGSLLAVILAHTFCNWMGLPRFWGRVGATDDLSVAETIIGGEDIGVNKRGDGATTVKISRHGSNLATAIYYALLLAGALAFYKNLWHLTESQNALMSL